MTGLFEKRDDNIHLLIGDMGVRTDQPYPMTEIKDAVSDGLNINASDARSAIYRLTSSKCSTP